MRMWGVIIVVYEPLPAPPLSCMLSIIYVIELVNRPTVEVSERGETEG